MSTGSLMLEHVWYPSLVHLSSCSFQLVWSDVLLHEGFRGGAVLCLQRYRLIKTSHGLYYESWCFGDGIYQVFLAVLVMREVMTKAPINVQCGPVRPMCQWGMWLHDNSIATDFQLPTDIFVPASCRCPNCLILATTNTLKMQILLTAPYSQSRLATLLRHQIPGGGDPKAPQMHHPYLIRKVRKTCMR